MFKTGKRLEVDLTDGRLQAGAIDPDAVHRWLGGRALNVATLLARLHGPIDPLGPDNILLFSCGLLTGSGAPSSSRLHINAVSPLTGMLGSSNIGGHVAEWLADSGYACISVRGAADRPVFLEVDSTGARLRDARDLWELDTHEIEPALATRLGGDDFTALSIGPAGAHRMRFACIVSERDHVAGRTGLGAVMGAKNLKAIVVRKPARRKRRALWAHGRAAVADYLRQVLQSPDFCIYAELGGAGYVRWADDNGLVGVRNFHQTHFDRAAAIDGARLKEARQRSRGCAHCPVQCKAVLKFTEGRLVGKTAFRPEFEPMLNLGAKCGLDDIQAIVHLDNLCTRLGLDSTSAGTAIAFAMDLNRQGMLPGDLKKGMDLSWGSSDSMVELIEQMARGKGLGGILAQGVRRAARQFGPEAERYAAHVKGLELSAYHPAALLGSALGYAISSRGGDYNNIYASLEHRWTAEQALSAFGTDRALDPGSYEGKAQLVRRAVLVNIMMDSLGICKVPALSMIGTFDLANEARLAAALTGWPLDAAGLFERAEKTAAAERLINLRCGLVAADDTLPEMFFSGDGPKLERSGLQRMVRDFYQAMDWTADGKLKAYDVGRLEAAVAALA